MASCNPGANGVSLYTVFKREFPLHTLVTVHDPQGLDEYIQGLVRIKRKEQEPKLSALFNQTLTYDEESMERIFEAEEDTASRDLWKGFCSTYKDITPLELALVDKNCPIQILQTLVNNTFVDLNLQSKKFGYEFTPLQVAIVQQSDERKANILIQSNRVNLDATSSNDMTAAHYAAQINFTSVLENLFARGADMTKRDSFGKTPLQLLASIGHFDTTIKVLDGDYIELEGTLFEHNNDVLEELVEIALLNDHFQLLESILKNNEKTRNSLDLTKQITYQLLKECLVKGAIKCFKHSITIRPFSDWQKKEAHEAFYSIIKEVLENDQPKFLEAILEQSPELNKLNFFNTKTKQIVPTPLIYFVLTHDSVKCFELLKKRNKDPDCFLSFETEALEKSKQYPKINNFLYSELIERKEEE